MVNYQPLRVDDFVAIQRLVHRYADAVVHRDVERWTSCWSTAAVWDLGGGRKVAGVDAIAELWATLMVGMDAVVHTIDNGDAWQDAGADVTASGRWYVTEMFRRAGGERGLLRAHYDDLYVRADGGWLFSNRTLRVHYVGPPDLTGEFFNTVERLAARS